MNDVCLVGRLTKDPTLSGTQEKPCVLFTLAVQRGYKNANGDYDADFPSCVAFGKTGDFVMKYFKKGQMMWLKGELRTGSYVNKDGIKVYTTNVWANSVGFAGDKTDKDTSNTDNANKTANSNPAFEGFAPITDDDELPFN